jgi:hypothetical protein
VEIRLSDAESSVLQLLLEDTLGELHRRVAGAENALHRRGLQARQMALEALWRQLHHQRVVSVAKARGLPTAQ